MDLINKANEVFLENFPSETCFERAIFFSWYCKIRDCKFCFMSTQKTSKKAIRSRESILAEIILCKILGWDIGFLSGGIDAYNHKDFFNLLKSIYNLTNEKIWINIGSLNEKEIRKFKPYIKGVVGSVECVNKKVHDKVCPSKALDKIEEMFKISNELGLKNAMTIILGLGETIEDFNELKKFIKRNNIVKIHIYNLNPQKGTIFENKKSPSAEYQAEWIAKTRINFPKIDIQCGIWSDKVDRVSLLLKAGANSISKFPIIKKFNSKEAGIIEEESKKAGREFKGSLTKLLKIDYSKFNIDEEVKYKLEQYIENMK